MKAKLICCAALSLLLGTALYADQAPTAEAIVRQMLDTDSWGLGDAEVSARAVIKDERGSTRELAFTGRSRRYAPPLSKS